MRPLRSLPLFVLAALIAGCVTVPVGTYFPDPAHPLTRKVAHALSRAARAAGDDSTRYGFALVRSDEARVYSDADATFYVTEGLARLPAPVVDAIIAHEVAHEVLRHAGKREALSRSMSAGFFVLGIVFPGAGLADFLVNPLVVRAFTRDQVKKADARAIEILRDMGYEAPRRALALALRQADAANGGKPSEGAFLATQPSLTARLAALEPLEPAPATLAEAIPAAQ